jgi:chromosome segregation ATPase
VQVRRRACGSGSGTHRAARSTLEAQVRALQASREKLQSDAARIEAEKGALARELVLVRQRLSSDAQSVEVWALPLVHARARAEPDANAQAAFQQELTSLRASLSDMNDTVTAKEAQLVSARQAVESLRAEIGLRPACAAVGCRL